MIAFPAKDPAERRLGVFSFADDLDTGDTVASAVCTISVLSGTDASPSAVLDGAAAVMTDNVRVKQWLKSGVAGVDYEVRCAATSAQGAVLVAVASLQVRTLTAGMSDAQIGAASHVKRTLDALEATLEGKASNDQLAYSIAGRSLQRMTPGELLKWRDQYRAEYAREQAAARVASGLAGGGRLLVRG